VANELASVGYESMRRRFVFHVGIDLAKKVFAVHGVDEHGKPTLVSPAVPRVMTAHKRSDPISKWAVALPKCYAAFAAPRLASYQLKVDPGLPTAAAALEFPKPRESIAGGVEASIEANGLSNN
jgi:hypothetical protein